MREIKFRAWDKKYRKFFEVNLVWGLQSDSSNNNRIQDFEFQQYTGLKDKNGVEIYEGDVINFSSFGGAYEVKFKDGVFHPFEVVKSASCEVIGNIYQNPELLK